MNSSEKIETLLNYLNLNAKAFADALGYVRPQIIYDIQKGKTKRISSDLADKVTSVFPEISRSWLLADEGGMLRSENEPTDISTTGGKTVPLIPVEAFAGPIQRYIQDGVREEDCRKVVTPVSGAELAVPVSGDSMSPDIPDGATLFVSRINDAAFIPWGNVMVLDTENGALVKRIYPSRNDSDAVEARSINPEYPPFDVPKSSIRGIYRVLAQSKYYPTM